MTRNNFTVRRNEKNKAPCEQLAVVTLIYRKRLNTAHNRHFLEKLLQVRRFLPTCKSCGVLLPALLYIVRLRCLADHAVALQDE